MPAPTPHDTAAQSAPARTNMPKLSVENLDVFYGEKQALSGVNLTMNRNEVTALIGPSGCGKTTLLKALNRLLEINPLARISGSILMDGDDIHDPGLDIVQLRQRFGVVAQKPDPFPFSIEHNIAYGPKLHGKVFNRKQIEELIERCLRRVHMWDEVKDVLKQPGTSLSGGQQQRLCIARAIAYEPEVILLDEPCSALDPIATQHIEDLIGELRRDYTLVIVTHNMEQAKRVCDRAAFFYRGKMIESGTRDDLFERPSEELTQDFVNGKFG
jgi:phosphate transport system ATP-binding protein